MPGDVNGFLPIACAADEGYLPHCAAMLHSLCGVHDPARLHVYFLHDNSLDVKAHRRLQEYATGLGARFTSLAVGPEMTAQFPDHVRFGRVAWYRILLPQLLPELDRVLYIDSDAIVTAVLDELFAMPLGNQALAAVTDPIFPPASMAFYQRFGIPGAAQYFNSGVLLMNLATWRSEGLSAKLLDFIRRGEGLDSWPDQNALNAVLWGRRRALAPRWNAMNRIFEGPLEGLPHTEDEIKQARSQPAIVHYVGPYKPWHYRCKHPLRQLYFQHRSQTPWASTQLDGRTLYHRLMRLLPIPVSIRLELRLYRERARVLRWLRRGA